MIVNQIPPDTMSPRDRAQEIVSIIVTAIARLNSTKLAESAIPFDLVADESVHDNSSLSEVIS